jgi:hypothetical protein
MKCRKLNRIHLSLLLVFYPQPFDPVLSSLQKKNTNFYVPLLGICVCLKISVDIIFLVIY